MWVSIDRVVNFVVRSVITKHHQSCVYVRDCWYQKKRIICSASQGKADWTLSYCRSLPRPRARVGNQYSYWLRIRRMIVCHQSRGLYVYICSSQDLYLRTENTRDSTWHQSAVHNFASQRSHMPEHTKCLQTLWTRRTKPGWSQKLRLDRDVRRGCVVFSTSDCWTW